MKDKPSDKTTPSIEDVTAKAVAEMTERVDRNAAPMEIEIHRALNTEVSATKDLLSAIEDDETFGLLRGGWLSTPEMGMALQEHLLPYHLVSSGVHGSDTNQLISELREFAKSKRSGVEKYFAIVGITVNQQQKLTDDRSLIPWAQVPESRQKKVFGENSDFSNVQPPIYVPLIC